MSGGHQVLTEKEKETLRLVVRGYDAKSLARHLGLSVHTVNERLRSARRKMAVSSSREAARILLENENGGAAPAYEYSVDKRLGDAEAGLVTARTMPLRDSRWPKHRFVFTIGGVAIMATIFATLLLASMSQVVAPPVGDRETASGAVVDSETVQSARRWLELVDDERWGESYKATGQSFRKLNTDRKWASVSQKVRPPLGAVLSRTVGSSEWVPAPPRGYAMVKFRTNFANRPDALETLTLVREAGTWKVVGYTIG